MDSKEILNEVRGIFRTKWETREGRKVPEPEDLKLGNDAVQLKKATVLYADMADSTGLVNGFRDWFAAEIYKSYLIAACRVIRENDGVITAFDGDRVMGIFVSDTKNTSATKAALQIAFLVREINKALKVEYPNTSFTLKQTVGIDTSALFAARTGIRKSNDLVWVGRAANYAAKLSNLGVGDYCTYITEDVFNQIADSSKYGGNPRTLMWEKRTWTATGKTIYRSSWWWAF